VVAHATTMAHPTRYRTPNIRAGGRLPPAFRVDAILRAAGRPWNQLAETDAIIAAALEINVRNACRRREGRGPYAALCVELYRLARAGINVWPLIAHLKSIAMQALLRHTPTDELEARRLELRVESEELSGKVAAAEVRMGDGGTQKDRRAVRDLRQARAALDEELVAIEDELEARRRK
jgi:hypothetical protein